MTFHAFLTATTYHNVWSDLRKDLLSDRNLPTSASAIRRHVLTSPGARTNPELPEILDDILADWKTARSAA